MLKSGIRSPGRFTWRETQQFSGCEFTRGKKQANLSRCNGQRRATKILKIFRFVRRGGVIFLVRPRRNCVEPVEASKFRWWVCFGYGRCCTLRNEFWLESISKWQKTCALHNHSWRHYGIITRKLLHYIWKIMQCLPQRIAASNTVHRGSRRAKMAAHSQPMRNETATSGDCEQSE